MLLYEFKEVHKFTGMFVLGFRAGCLDLRDWAMHTIEKEKY